MSNIEILVPDLPESVSDATVASWHKKQGDQVKRDEVLVEIETDKIILEVVSEDSGVLESIVAEKGDIVLPKQLLGFIKINNTITSSNLKETREPIQEKWHSDEVQEGSHHVLTPAAHRFVKEDNLSPTNITGAGIESRLTRNNIEKHISKKQSKTIKNTSDKQHNEASTSTLSMFSHRSEKRVPMTRFRKRIAELLLETKNNTAMLTTFNEVNMKPVFDLRKNYGESFKKRHGVRLGFMSFYVKAVIEALKCYPEVNASIDGSDVIYHSYFDINIAVSTPRGLVTPVLRDANALSMAEIENRIQEFSIKGHEGNLTIEELTGGNFTITNGGIFGSLMSTPIINPSQSAILGMHAIKDRPMAVSGKIKILQMMYVALSYDHRLIDGRESVSFLVRIKDLLEDPSRLLLDV